MLSLIIRTSFTALHSYPGAPEAVSFLAHPHAHQFNVSVKIRVTGDNREHEFFLVKREIDNAIDIRFLSRREGETIPTLVCNPSSCENLAKSLAIFLGSMGYEVKAVEVQEDDGCSGVWEADGL